MQTVDNKPSGKDLRLALRDTFRTGEKGLTISKSRGYAEGLRDA